MPDVAHELAGQVLDRGKYPAGNDIALDLGEPVFDLVEPRGVGRRVVKVQFRVSRKELLDPLGLMGREIVGNDMNLLARRLVGDQVGEEGDKLLAGVARGGDLSEDGHLPPCGYGQHVPRDSHYVGQNCGRQLKTCKGAPGDGQGRRANWTVSPRWAGRQPPPCPERRPRLGQVGPFES